LASVRHRKNRMEEAARTAIHPALDPRHIRDVTRCHAHDEGVAHVKHAPTIRRKALCEPISSGAFP